MFVCMGNVLIQIHEAVEELGSVVVEHRAVDAAVRVLREQAVGSLERAGGHPVWKRVVRPAGVRRSLDSKAFKADRPVEYLASRVVEGFLLCRGDWGPAGEYAVDLGADLGGLSQQYGELSAVRRDLGRRRSEMREAVRELVGVHRDELTAVGAWYGECGVRYADGRVMTLERLVFSAAQAEREFPQLTGRFMRSVTVPEQVSWRYSGRDSGDE